MAHEAQRIVDKVLEQSLLHMRERTGEEYQNDRGRFIESENEQWKGETSVKWPKISEFTDENVGLEKINEYIEKVTAKFVSKSKSIRVFLRNGKLHPVVKMNVGCMLSILSNENLLNSLIIISIE